MKVAEGPFRSERGTLVLTGFTHKLRVPRGGSRECRVGRVDSEGLAQFACLAIKTPVGRLGPRYSRDIN